MNIAQLAAKAAGPYDMDYLQLENAFARVLIERYRGGKDGDDRAPSVWNVSGDTARGPLAFPRMHEAMAYAFESLALYEQGRAD